MQVYICAKYVYLVYFFLNYHWVIALIVEAILCLHDSVHFGVVSKVFPSY